MDLSPMFDSLKKQVFDGLETQVYEQAVQRNLVDTVLRELVESAVERMQVEMPAAASVGSALLGVFGALAPTVKSLGLDQQIMGYVREAGLDAAMRERVIRGITRYLEENGAHLMDVAVQAVVAKLTRAA